MKPCKSSLFVLWLSIGWLQIVAGQMRPGLFSNLFGSSSKETSDDSGDIPESSTRSESKNSSESKYSQAGKAPYHSASQLSSIDSGTGFKALSQECESKAARFGVPNGSNLKVCESYIISYDCRLKHPNWVLQHLTPQHVSPPRLGTTRRSKYYPDSTLHHFFRATNKDYLKSGFIRGRMCPAYNDLNDKAQFDQSFCLSVIAPQLPGLNRGPWSTLEEYANYLAARSKNMYIVTGTAYLPVKIGNKEIMVYEVIGDNEVSTPTHFYKVWIREDGNGELSMEAFVLPNSKDMDVDTELAPFRMIIDGGLEFMERSTGLIFFDKVNRDKLTKPLDFQSGFVDKLGSHKMESRTPGGSSSKTSAGLKSIGSDLAGSSSDSEAVEPNLNPFLVSSTSFSSIDNLELIVRALVATDIQSIWEAQADLTRSVEENKVIHYNLLDEIRSLVQSQGKTMAQLQREQKTMKDQIINGLQTKKTDVAQIKQEQGSIRGHMSSELESLKESQRNNLAQVKQEQNSLKALILSEMRSLEKSLHGDLTRSNQELKSLLTLILSGIQSLKESRDDMGRMKREQRLMQSNMIDISSNVAEIVDRLNNRPSVPERLRHESPERLNPRAECSDSEEEHEEQEGHQGQEERQEQVHALGDASARQTLQSQEKSSDTDVLVGSTIEPKNSLTISPEVEPGAHLGRVLDFLAEASKVGLPSGDNLKLSENYILSKDRVLKHPTWMFEHFTAYKPKKSIMRHNLFEIDSTIKFTPHNIVERVAVGSVQFGTSSIAPQKLSIYRSLWTAIDSYVTNIASQSRNLYVVTGVLYLPVGNGVVSYQVIGDHKVGIPTHFYKIVLQEDRSGQLSLEALVLPNYQDPANTEKPSKYRLEIERGLPEIEHAAGLRFFPNVDRSKIKKSKPGHPSIKDLERSNINIPTGSDPMGARSRPVAPTKPNRPPESPIRVIARVPSGTANISLEIFPELDPAADEHVAATLLSEVSYRLGLPSEDNLKVSENYILSFNRRLKHPNWVMERIMYEHIVNDKIRKRFFDPEELTYNYFQIANELGHNVKAPAEKLLAHGCEYCMSDIAPQLSVLQSGPMRLLERYVADLAIHTNNLYAITGVLYQPMSFSKHEPDKVQYQLIGANQVGVPTNFYKILVSEDSSGNISMEAFDFPNSASVSRAQSLAQFQIDIDKDLPRIEKVSGLTFFDKLDRTRVTKPKLVQSSEQKP